MPAEFEQGFFVRVPAWHGLGVVLDDYPGREEAMRLAGHDWNVVEAVSFTGFTLEQCGDLGLTPNKHNGLIRKDEDWKSHVRSDTGELLHKSQDSFQSIPNSVAYDLAEALLDQGFKYETGITLKGGKLCALTLLLDEPFTVPGDDSELLPYLGIAWAHDGSAALKGNPTTIRRVCANTVAASEAEGARNGNSFSIRHTKNWRDYVQAAKDALKGVRQEIEDNREFAIDLAAIRFTDEQVREFIERFTTPPEVLVSSAQISQRVATNIANAQAAMRNLIEYSPTVPDAHRRTGWGVYNASVEYLDHIRGTRGQDGRTRSEALVQRTLLTRNAAKATALSLVREIAA